MALLDEQLVEEWLNSRQYFTMRGVKCGVDEIDLLAIQYNNNLSDFLHVEVQVSYRPIGYIGGDTNAKKRSEDEIKSGVEQWFKKKFTNPKKVIKRNSISPNAKWKYIFVHGKVKDSRELDYIKELGVDLVPCKDVLRNLRDNTVHQSSSIASNITEIIKYMHES